jgi:uncharacterized protein YneF (UPF0154 family)
MGKRILFWIIIILFIIAFGIGGFYLYRVYFSNTDKTTPVDNPEAVSAIILTGIINGGNSDYPQNIGGIDDYNNGATMPTDTYYKAWIACSYGNDYCDTGDAKAEKKDPNTGLVWSVVISPGTNWFIANNCKYPNDLPGDDGTCDTNGEVSCRCVKNTGINVTKTGCDALTGGKWRLPYQKELMQAYIDGSYANLSNTAEGYWSSTTRSTDTETAWAVFLNYGNAGRNKKTVSYTVRCVR